MILESVDVKTVTTAVLPMSILPCRWTSARMADGALHLWAFSLLLRFLEVPMYLLAVGL